MKELEVIGKEVEIFKIKLFLFMAISGGSWVYILKFDKVVFVAVLILTFIVATFGIYFNVLKLSDLQKELKGLKNG